jgi:galactokinase
MLDGQMDRCESKSIPAELADVARRLGEFFRAKPVWAARVPARLDVMGGIADYSGANVCEATLGAGVVVAVQPRADRLLRIRTSPAECQGLPVETCIPLDHLAPRGKPATYEQARELFRENPLASWAAYAAGSLLALMREEAVRLETGLDVWISSAVPMNAGVASSAAVEIGALCAFDACLGLKLSAARIAQLGQVAENRVVGAPCGIMDQIAIASGRRGKLLHILCRPGSVVGPVPIPKGTGFAGIHSGVRHSVAAAPYGDVRIGAFMGKRILNERRAKAGREPVAHLTEIAAAELASYGKRALPEQMSGADFLARHGTHEDPATTIRPGVVYRIRGPASHAIFENERVLRFIEALRAAAAGDASGCVAAGVEMEGSHASYRDECRLSVPEVDGLVEAVGRIGAKRGLYGAKITGGGAGGTVAVYGRVEALKKELPGLVREYERQTGLPAAVFGGTSPGAVEFGARVFKPERGGWTCRKV